MTSTARVETSGFRHEAALYHGPRDLVGTLLPFLREGVARREAVLLALPAAHLDVVRLALGADASRVAFLDMCEVGANPGRILGEWRRFVERNAGAPGIRGVGEPAWPGRRGEELEECRLHESLLNVAFDGGPSWRLLCPYDADALPSEVVDDVSLTHPGLPETGRSREYGGHAYARRCFERPLPPAPGVLDEIPFGPRDLTGVRAVVRRICEQPGLPAACVDDLALAVHELATNSVAHGGGTGVLRAWTRPDALVLEVSDSGVIADVLVGRGPAPRLADGGRGVWLVHQLCDLVQVRSSSAGTVVRLYTWLPHAG